MSDSLKTSAAQKLTANKVGRTQLFSQLNTEWAGPGYAGRAGPRLLETVGRQLAILLLGFYWVKNPNIGCWPNNWVPNPTTGVIFVFPVIGFMPTSLPSCHEFQQRFVEGNWLMHVIWRDGSLPGRKVQNATFLPLKKAKHCRRGPTVAFSPPRHLTPKV